MAIKGTINDGEGTKHHDYFEINNTDASLTLELMISKQASKTKRSLGSKLSKLLTHHSKRMCP